MDNNRPEVTAKCQPPSGGCVLKPALRLGHRCHRVQPPSGGCVLKRDIVFENHAFNTQPPSGGCVLKPAFLGFWTKNTHQPPSGGCVLKPDVPDGGGEPDWPAAFRRLCVETPDPGVAPRPEEPAAFRRLCVETLYCHVEPLKTGQPPSGGCVLKPPSAPPEPGVAPPSRLQAAVC